MPPALEERLLGRLRRLPAIWNGDESDEPTDEQTKAVLRELYQARADLRDGQDAEKTLPSAVSLIEPAVAAAMLSADAETDGEQDGRPTWEDDTRIFDVAPGELHAQLAAGAGAPLRTVDRRPLIGVALAGHEGGGQAQ